MLTMQTMGFHTKTYHISILTDAPSELRPSYKPQNFHPKIVRDSVNYLSLTNCEMQTCIA